MWVTSELLKGDFRRVSTHEFYHLTALVGADGSTLVVDEELGTVASLKEKGEIVSLSWHPLKKMLALSWSGVGIWFLEFEGVLREGNIHSVPLATLKWSPDGHRLITGDVEGMIVVWKIDNKGRLSAVSQYRLKEPVLDIEFKNAEQRTRDKETASFFMFSKDGSIYHADDVGHCDMLATLEVPAKIVKFNPKSQSLFVLTHALSLDQFLLSDGRLVLSSTVKLSGGSRAQGNIACTWIGDSGVAYSLNGAPPQIGQLVYNAISYNPKNQTLALVGKIDTPGDMVSVNWTASSSILALRQSGVQFLSDQKMMTSAFGTNVYFTQTDATKLKITNGTVHGIAEASRKVKNKMEVTKINTINCESGKYCISQKHCITASQTKVEILNTANNIAFTIGLPTQDGTVDYLVSSKVRSSFFVISDKSVVKKFEIQGNEAKLLSTVRCDLSNASMIQVNCAETYLASVASDFRTISIVQLEDGRIQKYTMADQIESLYWDLMDPRFLVVACSQTDHLAVASFFVTPDQGIVFKDTVPLANAERLLAISIPSLVYLSKGTQEPEIGYQTIREYLGIEKEPYHILKMMTDFCCHLALGQVEEAMKSVKLIKNDAVWESMAKMCIKLRKERLARHCLGRLKNAHGLRLVRDQDPQKNLLMMAILLGMAEEARELAQESNNFELLGLFHQASGKWEQGLEIVAAKDRLALPMAFYNFAKHLSETGDQSGAIAAFEKSQGAKSEIPRLLMRNKQDLENYMASTTDTEIIKWFAQNAEGHLDYETALSYYEKIQDFCSQIRVHCVSGDFKKAMQLADTAPDNHAGLFLIANELESQGKYSDAIAYYGRAKSFGSAIRLAMEHKINQELTQLAFQGTPKQMYTVAKYFEDLNLVEKAIPLYEKAGNVAKALQLCMEINNVPLMESIAHKLNPETDADLLHSIAEHLKSSGSDELALKVMITSQKYEEALSILENGHIPVTEELMDKFNLEGLEPQIERHYRSKMADICFKNGLFHMASKQVKAMGALLKLDVSKNPEIYTIAANFLQSLNWRGNTDLLKSIIQFYTKAKAFQPLALFYESCAQIEIDEFQNYEKVLGLKRGTGSTQGRGQVLDKSAFAYRPDRTQNAHDFSLFGS
ncbi:hypothetical protein EDD86DRAFT_246061 [Gorgonomyces haynaldii]|nr:hypothetical protein EDD86DRAFT_246061 [Gorgonomyces haynaldii]